MELCNKGKVRNVYKSDDNKLKIKTTNRFSCFDRYICDIPDKAKNLNHFNNKLKSFLKSGYELNAVANDFIKELFKLLYPKNKQFYLY